MTTKQISIQFTESQCSLMMVAITEELKALEENYKNGEHSKEYFKENAKELREIYDLLLKAKLNHEETSETSDESLVPYEYFADFLFTTMINTGESISYRDIRQPSIHCNTVVNGFGVDEDHRLQYIEFGTLRISPKDLLENYEYRDDGEWKKFGKRKK